MKQEIPKGEFWKEFSIFIAVQLELEKKYSYGKLVSKRERKNLISLDT